METLVSLAEFLAKRCEAKGHTAVGADNQTSKAKCQRVLCSELQELPILGTLVSLEELLVDGCEQVKSMEELWADGCVLLKSMEELWVDGYVQLKSMRGYVQLKRW